MGKLDRVSVSIVAVFVIFGAILNAGEAGKGFMNIAVAAAGGLKGGAAKVSVLASALLGRYQLCLSQCCLHRDGYIARNAKTWLSKTRCWSGRGCCFYRRANNASSHGRRRICDGRINGNPLRENYLGCSTSSNTILLDGMGRCEPIR